MSGHKFCRYGDSADFNIDHYKVMPDDDSAVFAIWFKGCYPALLKKAATILDSPEDAADAVQEAVIKLLKYHHKFRGEAKFRTYVMRAVINQSCNVLRKRQVYEKHIRRCLPENSSPGSDEILDKKLIVHLLVREINKLPRAWRRIIYLRYYCQWPYGQIAAALNCSDGTVKSRLFRSKRDLKKALRNLSKYDFNR